MTLEKPLSTNDVGDQAIFGDTNQETAACLATDDSVGVFVGESSIIIKAGTNSIVIDNTNIFMNGKVVQRDFVESTTRASMTNPLGMLPGTIIPFTIPMAFSKLPDPGIVMPFLNIATTTVNIVNALTKL